MNVEEILGNRVTEYAGLVTFHAPPGMGRVIMTSDEVTAVCPVTGQPDWYTVTIDYQPGAVCLESKSLKLFLQSFRNTGVFCEMLARLICDEIAQTLDPVDIRVEVEQKPRGGISIIAEVRH